MCRDDASNSDQRWFVVVFPREAAQLASGYLARHKGEELWAEASAFALARQTAREKKAAIDKAVTEAKQAHGAERSDIKIHQWRKAAAAQADESTLAKLANKLARV